MEGAPALPITSELELRVAEGTSATRFGDGRSPSGKAPAFGAGIEGSNPSRRASSKRIQRVANFIWVLVGAVHRGTALIILVLRFLRGETVN